MIWLNFVSGRLLFCEGRGGGESAFICTYCYAPVCDATPLKDPAASFVLFRIVGPWKKSRASTWSECGAKRKGFSVCFVKLSNLRKTIIQQYHNSDFVGHDTSSEVRGARASCGIFPLNVLLSPGSESSPEGRAVIFMAGAGWSRKTLPSCTENIWNQFLRYQFLQHEGPARIALPEQMNSPALFEGSPPVSYVCAT